MKQLSDYMFETVKSDGVTLMWCVADTDKGNRLLDVILALHGGAFTVDEIYELASTIIEVALECDTLQQASNKCSTNSYIMPIYTFEINALFCKIHNAIDMVWDDIKGMVSTSADDSPHDYMATVIRAYICLAQYRIIDFLTSEGDLINGDNNKEESQC